MDKNSIKRYAVWARKELIEKVALKAQQYGVEDTNELDGRVDSVNGILLTDEEKRQRSALIRKIAETGYKQTIEEIAYTWFNRFIALRFMEVNGYLPSHVRIFTDENNSFNPQIMNEALHLELENIDQEKIIEMKQNNDDDELFKYLLILQCNDLSKILPCMFEKLSDYTELLLPDYLLRAGSVIDTMINDIAEENFRIDSDEGGIEIIGWFYQYYISEKHDEIIDPIHSKTISKDDIPAATQLFTTDWVVKYIVDNSLGKYWIDHNRSSELGEKLEYFISSNFEEIDEDNILPEDVTVFDPCIGSGHFIVYAFDVLVKIYGERGYSERDAVREIVKKNIYGLDIDNRAVQLANFAIIMKARQYDRRFFSTGITPNVYAIPESNGMNNVLTFVSDNGIRSEFEALMQCMKNAKEYGSLISIEDFNWDAMESVLQRAKNEGNIIDIYNAEQVEKLLTVAKIIGNKYSVVITNPPYMNKYDSVLKDYLYENYKDYAGDLFSAFIYRNMKYCISDGYTGFMTPNVWMFIASYEKLREYIVSNKQISALVQMAKGAFFKEATVDVCAFVIRNKKGDGFGNYQRLEDFKGDMEVQKEAFIAGKKQQECDYFYRCNQRNYTKIKGTPIAYWLNESLFGLYENTAISDIARPCKGIDTGNNKLFLRLWYELDNSRIQKTKDEPLTAEDFAAHKWYPYNKGGAYRKWFGNNDYVINWGEDGSELANFKKSNLRNKDTYFKKGLTWSTVTSGGFSLRAFGYGHLFDNGGCCLYSSEHLMYILGYLNSNVAKELMQLSPTLNTQPGDIGRLPIVVDENAEPEINDLVDKCISLCKDDWNSYENSWDYQCDPLVKLSHEKSTGDLKQLYKCWEDLCKERRLALKQNEERLNEIFIHIFGLNGVVNSHVEDKDLSIKLPIERDSIERLISYSVGCMFGRYSLDCDGLIYTGGTLNKEKYSAFPIDEDNIIPVLDDEYFRDDIVARFVDFMSAAFGKENLESNLMYVAEILGGKGQARSVIRDYFLNNFFESHCSRCSVSVSGKRPYYWLFDSGKKNGFKCLIYMQRYQPDTIARIRTDYVHEQQARYRTAIEETTNRIESASGSDKVKLTNKLKTLKAQDEEIHVYEEKIHHLADQMISIDLDDGVKKNYEIFKDVLAKIK